MLLAQSSRIRPTPFTPSCPTRFRIRIRRSRPHAPPPPRKGSRHGQRRQSSRTRCHRSLRRQVVAALHDGRHRRAVHPTRRPGRRPSPPDGAARGGAVDTHRRPQPSVGRPAFQLRHGFHMRQRRQPPPSYAAAAAAVGGSGRGGFADVAGNLRARMRVGMDGKGGLEGWGGVGRVIVTRIDRFLGTG